MTLTEQNSYVDFFLDVMIIFEISCVRSLCEIANLFANMN